MKLPKVTSLRIPRKSLHDVIAYGRVQSRTTRRRHAVVLRTNSNSSCDCADQLYRIPVGDATISNLFVSG